MVFAETGHKREGFSDLQVRLLMLLNALQQECEKLMELTVFSYRTCIFRPSRVRRDEVALSESVSTRIRTRER